MRHSLYMLLMLLLSMPQMAWAGEQTIQGLWATQDEEAVIEIYACGDTAYCGRFYWLKDEDPMNPSRDDRNPDKEKKKRLLCGLPFLGGFEKQEEAGDYGSGWVYSPRHGAKFSASMKLIDNDHLKMRGYFLFSFLGDEQVWTRKDKVRACHF